MKLQNIVNFYSNVYRLNESVYRRYADIEALKRGFERTVSAIREQAPGIFTVNNSTDINNTPQEFQDRYSNNLFFVDIPLEYARRNSIYRNTQGKICKVIGHLTGDPRMLLCGFLDVIKSTAVYGPWLSQVALLPLRFLKPYVGPADANDTRYLITPNDMKKAFKRLGFTFAPVRNRVSGHLQLSQTLSLGGALVDVNGHSILIRTSGVDRLQGDIRDFSISIHPSISIPYQSTEPFKKTTLINRDITINTIIGWHENMLERYNLLIAQALPYNEVVQETLRILKSKAIDFDIRRGTSDITITLSRGGLYKHARDYGIGEFLQTDHVQEGDNLPQELPMPSTVDNKMYVLSFKRDIKTGKVYVTVTSNDLSIATVVTRSSEFFKNLKSMQRRDLDYGQETRRIYHQLTLTGKRMFIQYLQRHP